MRTQTTNRLNPWASLQREIDQMFGGLTPGLIPGVAARPSATSPAVNIWDEGEAFVVEAELAGVKIEDIELYAVDNEFTLRGRRAETVDDQATYHRRERGIGEFTRVLSLPVRLDPDHVEAKLRDGVLTVRLPKAAEVRPRRIVVKASD